MIENFIDKFLGCSIIIFVLTAIYFVCKASASNPEHKTTVTRFTAAKNNFSQQVKVFQEKEKINQKNESSSLKKVNTSLDEIATHSEILKNSVNGLACKLKTEITLNKELHFTLRNTEMPFHPTIKKAIDMGNNLLSMFSRFLPSNDLQNVNEEDINLDDIPVNIEPNLTPPRAQPETQVKKASKFKSLFKRRK